MTPLIQNLVSEITGRPPVDHSAPPEEQQVFKATISEEDMRLAAAYRAMLGNDDFMAVLRDNEREARFELGHLDPTTATELQLRLAAAKWKTAREEPVKMSNFLTNIEKAIEERKNAVEKPKKDDKQFTPD